MAPFTCSQLSMSDHSLSCSATDQQHSGPCPQVTVKKGVLGKWLRKGGVVVTAGKWEKRQIEVFFWSAWRSPRLGPVGELEVPGNRLGTTSCSTPEPSLRPSSSLGPGLEEQWTSPPSMSLQPSSSGHLPGPQSLRTGLLTWTAWGDRTYWVGCLGPSRMRAEQNVRTLPEGAAKWDLFLLIQDRRFEGESCAWDFALSWQGKKDRK